MNSPAGKFGLDRDLAREPRSTRSNRPRNHSRVSVRAEQVMEKSLTLCVATNEASTALMCSNPEICRPSRSVLSDKPLESFECLRASVRIDVY